MCKFSTPGFRTNHPGVEILHTLPITLPKMIRAFVIAAVVAVASAQGPPKIGDYGMIVSGVVCCAVLCGRRRKESCDCVCEWTSPQQSITCLSPFLSFDNIQMVFYLLM